MTSFLSDLYPNFTINQILEEFDKLTCCFGVSIKYLYADNEVTPLEILKEVEQRKEDLQTALNNLKVCDNLSVVEKRLLPFVTQCTFSIENSSQIFEHLNNYLEDSQEMRTIYHHNTETHFKKFKALVKWLKETTMGNSYKVGLHRFEQFITEQDKSKYAFLHFLY